MYIYNLLNKEACVYEDCLDKYIRAAIWPPQIKISSSTPVYFIDLLLLLSQHNYKKKKSLKKIWKTALIAWTSSSLQLCSFAWAWFRLTMFMNMTSIHYPSSTFIKPLLDSVTRSSLQRPHSFSAPRYTTFMYNTKSSIYVLRGVCACLRTYVRTYIYIYIYCLLSLVHEWF